ncbi:MAG: 2-isopropylmalate synthase [Candidatus Diapherotrites archaeon]|nr:2-isopropylmalate synthase [Candidatus Diapherotrites archaeon]
MGKTERVRIFDTTLRDGEQSPGATLTHREKILIAQQLAKLKVDIIEAGFPVASEDDFKAVKEIADTAKGPVICALSRARGNDIDVAWKAIQGAKKPRIHTFMSSSDVHLKYQFKISRAEALRMSIEAVKRACGYCDNVEFSPMDATRTEPTFLFKMVEAAIGAGATKVNIPDTVGYAQPGEFGKLIAGVKEKVPNIESAVISVHCHNDLGLAVANSLEAVRNGARQVECTINGLGERAGNASLEEIAMNIATRKSFFNVDTGIALKEIYPSSRMVSNFTGIAVQRNKAIVGENAFAHEAGIHQHGLLANAQTYEIMRPEMIGKQSRLVLGKHSGWHATGEVLKQMGFRLSEQQLQQVSERIKQLADKQKIVLEEDIAAIASDVSGQLVKEKQMVVLDELMVSTGNKVKPTARVTVFVDGKKCTVAGEGVGPVDAVAHALQSVLPQKISLKEYHLKAITGGTDALADVVIKVENGSGAVFDAEAINEDVIMASANALVKGINKALSAGNKKVKPEKGGKA